jgi:hypothetical protein
MQTYGHYDFEGLLKDTENANCFDCGKSPAQWASVNNAIYLCLTCAGEHRGFGVSISYIRSITIDTWNDNQITMMRIGGNKRLKELLDLYNINKSKIEKSVLYNSRLLHFHRQVLKSNVNKENVDREPPTKEEALKSINVDLTNSYVSDSSKYSSVSKSGVKLNKNVNTENRFNSVSSDLPDENVDVGLVSGLNNWMSKIATTVAEIGIHNKIFETGNVVAETGSNIVTKGTEVAKSDKVQSFAKKANDGLNFVINKLFGGGKKEEKVEKVVEEKIDKGDIAKIDINNDVKFEKKK